MPPPQASAAAAFFERSSSSDDLENGFASELGGEGFPDVPEAPPPPFNRVVSKRSTWEKRRGHRKSMLGEARAIWRPLFSSSRRSSISKKQKNSSRQPPPDAAAAAAKASAWAAGVPSRSAALLSSSQLDALWAAVRSAATAFPPAAAAGRPPSPDDDDDPLSCREPALSTSTAAAAAASAPSSSAPLRLSSSPSSSSRRKFLTYAAYRRAAEDAARGGAGPAAAALLTARAFLRLAGLGRAGRGSGEEKEREKEDDEEGLKPANSSASSPTAVVVDAESLCDYLGQRAGQLQMHVHLSCFESGAGAGSGWLTEAGAAAFVRATLPQLARSGCGDEFKGKLSLEDHAAIAARKLVFFHGKNCREVGSGWQGSCSSSSSSTGGGSKRLRIREVLAGRALAELLELAAPQPSAPTSSSDDDFQQQQEREQADYPGGPPTNWFSAASAAAAAAAFASGAAAGVEAAAAAGLDLAEARVSFPDSSSSSDRAGPSPPSLVSAAEVASSGSLGIPAAALCELGDGTLSPLFAARLVEEKGDARALVAVFPTPPDGEEEESCSSSDDGEGDEDNGDDEEAQGDGDAMNVDDRQQKSRRRRRRRKTQPQQQPQQPPSLRATAGLSLPTFLDFLLAWSDRGDPKSVSWLWPALDLRGRGALSRRDVERLFEPVRRMWVERGQYEALRPSDVACEVFDIVAPDRPGFAEEITKADLMRCPMSGTVIGLLCDVVRPLFFFQLFHPLCSFPLRARCSHAFPLLSSLLFLSLQTSPLHRQKTTTGMLLRARLEGAPAAAGRARHRRRRGRRWRRRRRRLWRAGGGRRRRRTRGPHRARRVQGRRRLALCCWGRRLFGDGRRGVKKVLL